MNQFRPRRIFLQIFDDIRSIESSHERAYNISERIFMQKCKDAFGVPYRAYANFNSFETNLYKRKN